MNQREFVELGRGRCGSVWAKRLSNVDDDTNENDNYTVIKRGDGTWHRSVTKEHDIHKHIVRSATKSNTDLMMTGYQVNIPTAVDFITSDSKKWASLLPMLPPNYKPCIALENERIPPMPRPVRHLLAHTCYGGAQGASNAKLQAVLLDVEKNEQNCLVRPFLGRRRYQPQQASASSASSGRPQGLFVTLRNIPLHLDQMEELGLPVEQYASAMADTMAFLHWQSEIDAADVEFVLARPRRDQHQHQHQHQGQSASGSSSSSSSSSPLSIGSKAFTPDGPFGSHAMWLIDFDCCEQMATPTMTTIHDAVDEFLTIAARAFWRNDPYYPRPPANHTLGDLASADGKLWEDFKQRYLETSGEILERKGKDDWVKMLPKKVVEMIENTRGRWSKTVL